MVFTANISGVDYSKVQFEWKVSVGTIDGPKEPAISVALPTDQKDGDVTATVTVSGLPPGCADHASETASFSLGGDFMEADLYGRLSITDETARLANALDMAAKEGNLIAVIVIRTPKQSRINFNSRVRSITKIMQKLRIPKEKYVFIDGGDGDLQTTIYLLPPSVDPNIFRH